MASIKTQKLVLLDAEKNTYASGSASIVGNVYAARKSKKGHCQHPTIEKLGRVVWLAPDKRSGIFLSPTRGLVEYNVVDDVFNEVKPNEKRIEGTGLVPALVERTHFGDAYLAFSILNSTGVLSVLQNVFLENAEYERAICHIMHSLIKNGSRISCAEFIQQSAISYAIHDISIKTLDRDSAFFHALGDFNVKLRFFRAYIAYMRKTFPRFGTGCYLDSTPLPNNITDNPFNAFSSHGTGGPEKQTRLVLILDIESNKPVWFDFIQGNKLDHQTIDDVCEQLEIHLEIDVNIFILDAGYACRELFDRYNITSSTYVDENGTVYERNMIARMPEKPGYPYGDMYQKHKKMFLDSEYHIVRNEHTYFAIRVDDVKILGYPEYVYTYVDLQQALALNQQYRATHPAEWQKYTKEEKDWLTVKDGLFNLISPQKKTPEEILDEYLGRATIESIFKTPKEYLSLLPLKMWTVDRIRGKVLCDVITTICYLDIQNYVGKLQITIPRMWVSMSGLVCSRDTNNKLLCVSTPNAQIREAFETLHVPLPGHVSYEDFANLFHAGGVLKDPSLKTRPKNAGRPRKTTASKVRVPKSVEQREAEKTERRAQKAEADARKRSTISAQKMAEKAVQHYKRCKEFADAGRPKAAKRESVLTRTYADKTVELAMVANNEEGRKAARQAKNVATRSQNIISRLKK